MKAIGIQIKSSEAILVVLEKDSNNVISQVKGESSKFKIENSSIATQIKQFKDQINTAFDTIKPSIVGILARNPNAKGDLMPSPISFKLEGIIQLYENTEVQLIWKATLQAHYRRHQRSIDPQHKYQEDAFSIAYYLLTKE